ncbi:MAG: ATP-binding protein [Saprospiraceae bacterium]
MKRNASTSPLFLAEGGRLLPAEQQSEQQVSPLSSEDGGAVIAHTNITERRLAEEALRESEKRYRALSDKLEQKVQERTTELAEMNEAFEHAEAIIGMGNFKWDFQANTISWSKGMYAIYGLTPETFTPEPGNIMQFTHPEEVERVTANTLKSFETETALPLGYRIIAADGKLKHVYGSGVIITETADRKILVGTLTDVTADKEKEQQLLEANEQLQLKNQEIALSKYNKRFLTDFSERFSAYEVHIEFFNSLVQYIADLTHMDYVLVGRLEETAPGEYTVHTIALTAFGQLTENITYPLQDGPGMEVVLGNTYSYPENCRITFPKNQTLVRFNVEGYVGYPLYDMNGNAKGLIAVMHQQKIEDDETVSSFLKIVAKRAEMELERIQHEQELQQSNQMLANQNVALEKSNRDLEQFAHVASHDLQEPLRKIQTFTNLLQLRGGDKAELEKYTQKIEESAARMSQLIQSVLNYSRVTQSHALLEQTDLNDVFARIGTDFELLIEEKNAQVEVGPLPTIPGLPLQLSQLFSNLLSNALKFSTTEHPLIRISALPASTEEVAEHPLLDPARQYVHLIFEDNGIGFSQQYSERIFAIFQRLHDKQAYAGTGIGLALCKKIVDNHGGDISAHGELDKGARFDIYLPTD